MKIFTITASGKTLSDVVFAIEEAKNRIDKGNHSGFDSNEDGEFSFSSEGKFDEEDSDEDENNYDAEQENLYK